MIVSGGDVLKQFQNLQQSGLLSSFEDLNRENKELQRIISDMTLLASHTDADSMLSFIISRFLDYFIPQTLVFFIKQPRTDFIQEHFYKNLTKSDITINTSAFFTLKNYFDSNIDKYKTGDVVFFENLIEELGSRSFRQDFHALKPNIVIPLIGIGGVYGITVMGNKLVGGAYTKSETDYLHHMFSMLAITLQNELHYRSVITDVKTGLFTYDYFVKRLQERIAAVQRHKASAAVLMLDIDYFKKINDTFGHLVGDKVLVTIAQTLLRITREDDCVARFGGEEFSVLLSECLPDALFAAAERIRVSIANTKFYENGDYVPITVSIGACYIDPCDSMTPDKILKRVDRALYLSKERGRNKTTVFSLGLLEKALLQAKSK